MIEKGIELQPKHWSFFWAKVIKIGNCWVWTAFKDHDGYGSLSIAIKGRRGSIPLRAHRLSYQLFKGEIPKGLQIDHLCRNRACVNPDHLEVVTCKENIRRGKTGYHKNRPNVRKTHCLRGHLLSGDNLVPSQLERGIRDCKQCGKIRHKIRIEQRRRRGLS